MARFIRIGSHPLSVKMYAEIIGKRVQPVIDGLKNESLVCWTDWDSFPARPKPDGKGMFDPSIHLYLTGEFASMDSLAIIRYNRKGLEEFVAYATNGKIEPDSYFYKFQFRRKDYARAVYFRPSDEKPVVNGSGLPNSRGRKTDPLHSELYTDRRPGSTFTNYKGEENQVWTGFERIYLKMNSGESSIEGENNYYASAWTEWTEDSIYVKLQMLEEGQVLSDELAQLRNFDWKVVEEIKDKRFGTMADQFRKVPLARR